MKNLSILGSTGSIGKNTVEIVMRNPELFKVSALAVMSNIELLESQITALRPEVVAVFDEASAAELRKKGLPVEILSGEEGVVEAARLNGVDIVVSAIVGSAGLLPTLAAVQAGKDVALANKEALVMAGGIIMSEASKNNVRILPVDSEHSAVFQCLHGREMNEVRRIILTASGGPFLEKSKAELGKVTPAEALKHPNWEMGRKITIDSATLMNKGLEVIEAYWLFGMPVEKIGVVVHPQSIVHSMVEFIDGSIIAQMSIPDMKGAISYAVSYPERLRDVMPFLDFGKLGGLMFEEPDMDKYESLALCYDAIRAGGTMPAVLNTANEVAVEKFLKGRIPFTGIPGLVSDTMTAHDVKPCESIEDVMHASEWARNKAGEFIGN
ncbi:MAG: 1-deoxy-D-xylulose-5-phosphate reductoisomerase [Nitrospirae bacterium]|nr:1-deoxy-D-xylulose-5-phosphate reductoisomerase [Nitrospirota bacterium]